MICVCFVSGSTPSAPSSVLAPALFPFLFVAFCLYVCIYRFITLYSIPKSMYLALSDPTRTLFFGCLLEYF